jgi:hypothetical protein
LALKQRRNDADADTKKTREYRDAMRATTAAQIAAKAEVLRLSAVLEANRAAAQRAADAQ